MILRLGTPRRAEALAAARQLDAQAPAALAPHDAGAGHHARPVRAWRGGTTMTTCGLALAVTRR